MKYREVEGELFVDGADVEAIKRLGMADELPAAKLIHEMRLLQAKVERLESSINMLFDINRMSASRFSKMSPGQLAHLHNSMVKNLEYDEWPTDRLLSFCEIFMLITEAEIELINRALETTTGWEPFYQLLIKTTLYVRDHPDRDTDLDLQRVLELFAIGRSNMRSIAMFFIHAHGDSGTSRDLLTELASNDVDMFDDMAKQLKASGRQGHLRPI